MTDEKDNDRHKARMQEQKAKVDERIAAAQEDKGLLLVLTGNGKGKSTSGFGTVARAVGHGLKASVVQYVKGGWECGERNLLEKNGVEFHVMGTGFTWETQDKDTDKIAAQAAWEHSKKLLQDPAIDVVLLDEITYMITYKYIDLLFTSLRPRRRKNRRGGHEGLGLQGKTQQDRWASRNREDEGNERRREAFHTVPMTSSDDRTS